MSNEDARTPAPVQAMPRWRELVNAQVDACLARSGPDDDALFYSLATVTPAGAPSVRTVGHRGFVNERIIEVQGGLLPSKHSSAAGTPSRARRERVDGDFGTTDALWITTDVRSEKAKALLSDVSEGASRRGALVWWFKDAGVQVRVSGSLHLISHASPRHRLGPVEPDSRNAQASFDWQAFRRRAWSDLQDDLVDALKRPAPGSVHPNAAPLEEDRGRWPGDNGGGDEDLDLSEPPDPGSRTEEAYKNFALLVLQPDEVDIWERAHDRRSSCRRDLVGSWTEHRIVP